MHYDQLQRPLHRVRKRHDISEVFIVFVPFHDSLIPCLNAETVQTAQASGALALNKNGCDRVK